MLVMKRYKIIVVLAGITLLLSSCIKEKLVDCSSPEGSYVCFGGEGREATYARWNFDTVQTFNAFNIQGSYPAVPGTTGPWTTVNLTLVNTNGDMIMETGNYQYFDFILNAGSRKFTFWVKRYEGEAQTPTVKNFEFDPYGNDILLVINTIDGTGKLSGLFEADVRNVLDTTETAFVKFRFTEIPLQ
jgi:hypothetical protein